MSSTAPRYLFVALYAAAVLVLLDQGAELVATTFPFRPTDVRWRFGAFGLLFGRTTTGVIVDVLLLLGALGLGHRGFLRFWGLMHVAFAVVLLGTLALFLLDALELRTLAQDELVGTLEMVTGRAVIIGFLGVAYCLWVAIAAVRSTRRPTEVATTDDMSDTLVVSR